ncbi:hypothetical protein I3842_13G069400 [Carya illinoinensis]|uniref:Uncharacterized protein n=1 Tax=Carya illinoinensis TaxID=32201 RepID=A0A922DCI4_CARIL|nr:hypothetical protein I3842_13G069400 [Carya illinoinensis]
MRLKKVCNLGWMEANRIALLGHNHGNKSFYVVCISNVDEIQYYL